MSHLSFVGPAPSTFALCEGLHRDDVDLGTNVSSSHRRGTVGLPRHVLSRYRRPSIAERVTTSLESDGHFETEKNLLTTFGRSRKQMQLYFINLLTSSIIKY